MTDRMYTLPFVDLLDWILAEYQAEGSIFGIPKELFFVPRDDAPYATTLFGERLSSPFGPAAGPHTQLTQNILAAWLVGSRFIELKTVQVMDRLEIPRPCIDMEDEGYNVEWSQELRLHESAREYAKAWVLVHVLGRLLGHDATSRFGTIFNMSVGYNMEGILQPTMQRFMAQLEDASEDIGSLTEVLKERYPRFADIEIPTRIVNSVTLSTMHGCPPDEIERIARYLIEERGLHTTVKLNPTLLGKERVLEILHDRLGYREIVIPDKVFEQDLRYERAIELIRALRTSAAEHERVFGVKLSNTLAMANHRDALPGDEMYMSGRALYPLTMQLFSRLIDELGEDLPVSYSAGADAFNVVDLASAGALPITVASDLLKPGGYSRMAQYIGELERAMNERGATTLAAFSEGRSTRVSSAAERALADPRYAKAYHMHGLPKVDSPLDPFDCIEAPCVAQCAVCQDVPDYVHWIAARDDDRALATILHRNPLPGVTGHVCTNLCQTRCTRNVYDQPVAIRRLKRFAVEQGKTAIAAASRIGHRVAVIGSGPSGLAAGYFLAACGIGVTIFEAKDRPGGMLAIAPPFRLPETIVRA
ncbi:NAD(P)-binding protein, partial [Candidatus Bipolaricaulota bacterium]